MSYQITITIVEGSLQAQNIEAIVEIEQVSREEAVMRLLARPMRQGASPEARKILGCFRDDADLMDEVMEIINADRLLRNGETPHISG